MKSAVAKSGPEFDLQSSESGVADSQYDLVEDLLSGADAGIALFDADRRLIRCNGRYRFLCGYSLEETSAGTKLEELVSLSLQRRGESKGSIERIVAQTIGHIQERQSYQFKFATAQGVINVLRRRLANGRLVETVQPSAEVADSSISSQIEQSAEIIKTRMMHALDVMADGFAFYDSDDRLAVYNRKFVELNQHITDMVMPGATFESLLVEGVGRGAFNLGEMAPERYIELQMERHREPGEAHEIELADRRWILVSEKRTEDGGIVGIRSDITELKKRELRIQEISRELSIKNTHFQSALNNMIQGLCMFDPDQKLIVCNNRYLDMYGFSPEVVKPGISLREIMEYSISLGNYSSEEAERALAERPDPKRLKRRVTIKQRLQDGRVIAVMNEPMSNQGSIATYQDITAIERHEKRQTEYLKKLERSNRELQDFAYVASHDLQEPLRKIEAFGDRLQKKYESLLPEDGQTYIERMQNAAYRMRQLINDLLTYSRVTTKAKPFKSIELNSLLEGVVSDLQVRIEETDAEIKQDELPTITGDPTQIRQLFQNLISNSLKFKKPDVAPVIKITAEQTNYEKKSGEVESFYKFRISDNGIGFDNQYKDQIFTIFQRLHGRIEYEGTGVGLATCRKIVERHHGTIDADGQPDVGSTFIFELPVEQPPDEEV